MRTEGKFVNAFDNKLELFLEHLGPIFSPLTCWIPGTALTNYANGGLKQQKFIVSQFLRAAV